MAADYWNQSLFTRKKHHGQIMTILVSRGNLSKFYRFPRLIDILSLDFRFYQIAFYVLIQHILIHKKYDF